MYDTTSQSLPGGFMSWPRRAEAWLDDRGKGAWIAAMVLGFIFVWPVGLALLAYMIWSKRMFNRSSCRNRSAMQSAPWKSQSSGNSAFDAYRNETIRRLEEEQDAFEAFLKRLRDAKDKQEFDAFMEDRVKENRSGSGSDDVSKDVAAY
jgi:hypothetical protein